MKKYAPKDPFTSKTFAIRPGVKNDSSMKGKVNLVYSGTQSVPCWDKPLSKKLTF